ncbi:MAG: DUF4303 domain-containing protein [Planctomycetaceae bacterium]|nr:DUF4303 domain-containing protein [Planctomycetaceae bacterium]
MSDLEKVIASLPYSKLTKRMPPAANALMERCLEYVDGEQLYGLSFCPNDDVTSFYWMANTTEALQRRAEKWQSRIAEEHPDTTLTVQDSVDEFRFEPPDWSISESAFRERGRKFRKAIKLCDHANAPIGRIWRKFQANCKDSADVIAYCPLVQKQLLDAMVDGLKKFDSNFDWSRVGGRDQFILLVFIPDGNPELVRDMARRLNPPPVWEQFAASYYSDEE